MTPRHEHSTPRARARLRGGTIINSLTAVVFLGLIGYGVYWVMKTTGKAGQDYATAMVNTHNRSTALSCQMNLRSIAQTLQTYAISNEGLPASRQELVNFAGYGSKLFRCPDPNGGEYVYLPGRRGDMAAPSLLLYESKPVHNGKCNVLFSNGQIASLSPEELQHAIEATQASRR
jgi:hypothetical protein